MNLKGHWCGRKESHKYLWAPADLEGHRGTDGRLYLLDFARVMPPEAPHPGVKNAHLFRLLRPEFVKSYKVPLCSDAFSHFVRTRKPDEHNKEIVEATLYLQDVLIPRFAVELNATVGKLGQPLYQFRLTEALHREGINIRYLDLLRTLAVSADCKTLLFVEMCARVIKNNIRRKLRQVSEHLKIPLEEPYRRLIVDYMNLVLGNSEESAEFWNTPLKRDLKKKFARAVTAEENDQDMRTLVSNFSSVQMDGKLLLFQRIQKMTGLVFTQRLNEELAAHPNQWLARGDAPIDVSDLEEIGQRVKHMNIISYAQGYLFKHQGSLLFGTDPLTAQRFFTMSMQKFEESLDTDPNNADTLCNFGDVLSLTIEGEAKHLSYLKYTLNNPKVQQVQQYYKRAIELNPNDPHFLFRYAQFFEKCDKPEQAEQLYLRSLQLNPNNSDCLQEYGNFLNEKGETDVAEQFFKRCSLTTAYAAVSDPHALSSSPQYQQSQLLLQEAHAPLPVAAAVAATPTESVAPRAASASPPPPPPPPPPAAGHLVASASWPSARHHVGPQLSPVATHRSFVYSYRVLAGLPSRRKTSRKRKHKADDGTYY
eukprot:TRINITY_DN3574_c0_g1_i1.p1 TRINITY_DN3574_c0_g1~~TRINITY_DN3574_c0_g1_i1.p1  ORF type:complete len:593 (-),score=166.43 TRINITY_DN3574_c0_g1_i1:44-1822(-)